MKNHAYIFYVLTFLLKKQFHIVKDICKYIS